MTIICRPGKIIRSVYVTHQKWLQVGNVIFTAAKAARSTNENSRYWKGWISYS